MVFNMVYVVECNIAFAIQSIDQVIEFKVAYMAGAVKKNEFRFIVEFFQAFTQEIIGNILEISFFIIQ